MGHAETPLLPPSPHPRRCCVWLRLLLGLAAVAAAVLGGLWQYSLVGGGHMAVRPPPHPANDPLRSVYLGMGCFWRTQYDMVVLERAPPFSRTADSAVTSLAGYAGGRFMGPGGHVCYHGNPRADYSSLGHTEVVQVQLDANASRASAQLQALAHHYFTQGFTRTPSGLQRADRMDVGPQYRNALGLPGGTNSTHYPAVVRAAAAVGMPLRQGVGGPDHDVQDEGVVWVYVSAQG